MATATEMVTALDDAILALVSGAQSYTVMGRSVTKANLRDLQSARDYYSKRAANAASTGRNLVVLDGMGPQRSYMDGDC